MNTDQHKHTLPTPFGEMELLLHSRRACQLRTGFTVGNTTESREITVNRVAYKGVIDVDLTDLGILLNIKFNRSGEIAALPTMPDTAKAKLRTTIEPLIASWMNAHQQEGLEAEIFWQDYRRETKWKEWEALRKQTDDALQALQKEAQALHRLQELHAALYETKEN